MIEIADYKLTKQEQETHFYEDGESDFVKVYTSVPKDMRRLEKRGWVKESEQFYDDETVMAMVFSAPRSCLSIRKYEPEKPKRIMSDVQKEKINKALSKYRNRGKIDSKR